MPNTKEIGYTGLNEYAGLIRDDFLKEFHGKEAYKRFNEMRLNNATIGSGLLAIEYVIRNMSWNFASSTDDDQWVEFLNNAMEDTSHSWNDFISEALSFIWAGYSLFEIVYKKNADGLWTWRKFAGRGQDTIYRWIFDEEGGLKGYTQMSSPSYKMVDVPIEKSILFRTRVEKNNPEGRSLLRPAWVSYYFLKNLQQIEAIGFERDANGLPVIKLPPAANTDEANPNSDANKAAKIVRNIRMDEQAGIVMPDGWDISLLSGSGNSFDPLANAIERYEKRIATSFFSQFLMLGQDGTGSLALSKNSSDFFMVSINSIADIMADTFTKYAAQRLMRLNGATEEEVKAVWLEHTPATSVDITAIGSFLSSVKDLLTWSAEDEQWLRQLAGAPEKSTEQLEEEREYQPQTSQPAQPIMDDDVEDDTEDDGDMPEVDMNSVTRYRAKPNERKRAKFERDVDKEMRKFFEAQRKRILKAAKAARDGNL